MTIVERVSTQIEKSIMTSISKCVSEGLFSYNEEPITLEVPREKEHGDFATNIAMLLCKETKKPPRQIAEAIVSAIDISDTIIESALVAGAGFINFKLNPSWLQNVLLDIEKEQENFGRVTIGSGTKVMVEFVSANPTGPMHMGNARGGALGDCLASVLSWAGFDVSREFYINDAGNQIDKFGKSLYARYMQAIKGEAAYPFPEDGYQGEDIKIHAEEFIKQNGDSLIGKPEAEAEKALIDFSIVRNIASLKSDLLKYRIEYDVWFNESKLHQSGEVDETIALLKNSKYTYEEDGALWFRATEFGLEKDEVLVRANGFATYFAVDIAYHRNKFVKRGFDKVIDIWGADHHGHVARMKGAMQALDIDPDRLEIILMQLVRLMQDGQVARMSKRTGKAITLSDLLEETSIDAARFFFNLRQANSHLDFDLNLAISQSSDNPVYYAQYAYARISSIITLLKSENIVEKPFEMTDVSLLVLPQELDLLTKLAFLQEEIKTAALSREPSRLTRYVLDIASLFHAFYNSCRVKCEDEELMFARLKLISGVGIVIKNILTMLKIETPERM